MPQIQVLPANPGFGSQIGQALGGGLGQGISSGLQQMLQNKQIDHREKEFISRGLPPALARLGAVATIGGQTEIFKYALDEFRRNQDPNVQAYQNAIGGQQEQLPDQLQQQQSQETPKQEVAPVGKFISQDIGLTPQERVAREKERYSTNLPEYQDISKKIHGTEKNHDLVKVLETLEKSEKLPKGLGRINVDAEGNLKLPFLSSSEAQRYVKTINEFSEGAKDTYGSRVTNFDLIQFMKRYPTLLNTAEGRRQIYQQMKIINDINKEYYSSLKKVYDDAGGVRKIDSDHASKLAEERSKNTIESLRKQYEDIGKPTEERFKIGQKFDKLPDPASMKGVTLETPSGNIRSTGSKWVKVKE